jgi:lauroyl/myristoyl acyltransferase
MNETIEGTERYAAPLSADSAPREASLVHAAHSHAAHRAAPHKRSWSAPIHAGCTEALLRLPPRALTAALDAIGLATYASVGASLRRDVTRAYEGFAEVTAASGERFDPRRLMREFWRAWPLRGEAPALVRYGSDALLRARVTTRGWENFEAALTAKRGVVIASVHAGCGSLPAALASRRGYRVMTIRSQALARHAGLPRGRHLFFGTDPVFVDFDRGGDAGVLKIAVEALSRNGIVSILCDHRLSGRSAPATMFGRAVAYRTSLLEVARLAGAPVVPAFGRASRRGIAIDFHPATMIASADGIAAFASRFAALHEALLRESPEQLGFVGFETQLFCPWAAPSLVSRFGRFQ